MTKTHRVILLLTLSLVGIISLLLQSNIPQSQAYHHFADRNTLCQIPNFMNVISNLFFVIIGLYGIYQLKNNSFFTISKTHILNYYLFFIGIVLTGFGSAYYHLHPNNDTLVYDRIPMTISFMSFFCIIIGEFISVRAGYLLLAPFILLGISSVYYWQYTETEGTGDLRFYILVQFLPMLLTPIILLLFKSNFKTHNYLWYIVLVYALAKLFETLDYQVFNVIKTISGHSIKHIVASFAPLVLLLGVKKRTHKLDI